MALAETELGPRFPSGGLSAAAVDKMADSMFAKLDVALTSDDAPADSSDEVTSPSGEPTHSFAGARATDLDQPYVKFLRTRIPATDMPADMRQIGRFGAVQRDSGQMMMIESLDGRLSLDGFSSIEVVLGVRVASRNQPKTRYVT